MAYAGGAGVNKTKKCLDGTRTGILTEIINWIQNTDENIPRILWLHGQAGRGKSAIAHTIALWLRDIRAFRSCFCFSRDRQAEHREEKIFATIARDLADHDPAFRRALADVLAKDHSLKATSDVTEQWERLILEPLLKVSSTMIGSMVVVVDALDESGLEESRRHILSVLASRANDLPHNIRILITSRPLPDIQRVLSGAPHVKATCLDDVSAESTEGNIWLYISKRLGHLPDIGDAEVQKISQKADCLFEWARLACDYIQPNTAGATMKEHYNDLVSLQSEEGRSLLDATYSAILESAVPKYGKALERYHSVMHQVMMTLEPLPMAALNCMRKFFPNKGDHYDVIVILEFMSPVLGGILDHTSPVQPLHASFYDFLTDHTRSGIYFIDTSCSNDLAVATLQILHELQFNICGLESSYLSNTEVADLPDRIKKNISPHLSYSCQFWSQHLEKTAFDIGLAQLVKALVGSERILFWLEAMSLMGRVGNAATALISAAKWLLNQDDSKDTLGLIEDEIKFTDSFNGAISHSAPHLYISALAFLPVKTLLSRMLMPKFSSLLGVIGSPECWQATQLLACEGHTDGVFSVAFSSDGKKIVSGSWDKTVRVWDAERGVKIGSHLEGHTDGVNSVAVSHDGKRIASGSVDKTIRVWDAERGVQIGSYLQGHTDRVISVAFSPSGKRIVSGSWDKTVRVWDAEGGVQIGSHLEGHTDRVDSVAFSPDGKRIVSGSKDKTVRTWDAETGAQIGSHLEGHTDGVNSVAFSPDGKRIVSGSVDKTVRVWDAERGVQIGSNFMGHTDRIISVAFSPDGKRVVSGSVDKTVRVWDAERGIQIGSHFEGHPNVVISVAFSPDGKRIVSGSWDKTVRVWDAERAVQMGNHHEGHTDGINSVAVTSDGKKIVSGSWDRTVRVWDAKKGVQIGNHLEGHKDGVISVAFSPDGKRITSGSWDKTVRVWDAERGVQIGSHLGGHVDAVNSVAFSPDGTKVVSGSVDKTVRVWDAQRGVQIGSCLEGHTDGINSVAFSPDSKRIVSGSVDKTVRVWDAETGVQIGNLLGGHTDQVYSVAFSPDGKRIVSGSWDRTLQVWDSERGIKIGSHLEGHTDRVYSVAFSPDGKRIVSGSKDKTVRVWDVEREVCISHLEGHTDGVISAAFSPDGKNIVSGSWDKTMRVWDANAYDDIINTNVQSQSPASNLSHALVPLDKAHGKYILCTFYEFSNTSATISVVRLCHICFSSISSHTLCDGEQLLDENPQGGGEPQTQPVKLHHDGWIRGPKGRLLLWIPVSMRHPLYSMWTTAVIPKGCIELDLSQMVHGHKWHTCYKPIP
ncbi:hypothetical protein PISMIDRAFT_118339 [Pisolithus microcarpus 441]|uniref:NACHT domain-containing protein n=1 Tax=Pisolithus microcarpus 441 TaxID=765257 RepID=A0A0C9YTT7_9AGAM|nr:hypothetical protein PISMIDRAFT_118339 [Pisolithus microcarpus 441]